MTTVQGPMFLLMLAAVYYGGCANSYDIRKRLNMNQNVDLHVDSQKAFKALAIKYIWLCLGMSIWSIKSIYITFDLTRDCFKKSRVIVIFNFVVLTAISTLVSIILILLIICCCPMFLFLI